MRAAVYARISRKTETTEDTIEEQVRRGKQLVEQRGWTLVGVFVDDGVSAYRDDVTRPEFERMLAHPDVEVIVVRRVDRLLRRRQDYGRITTAVAEWSGTGEVIPAMVFDFSSVFAMNESRTISERVKLSEARRVKDGKAPRGGRRAFGYNRDNTVNEAEAAVFRDLVDRYLDGETLGELCRWLHDEGIPTTSGNVWQPGVLSRMLRSPRRAGLRQHKGKMHEGDWPAIIDVDTHRRLVELSAARPPRRRNQTWLLASIVWCGRCENRLGSRTGTTHNRKRYACRSAVGKPACGLSVEAAQVERHVWRKAVGKAWELDEADQSDLENRLSRARAEIADVERQLQQVNEGFRRREVSYDLWVEMTRGLEDDAAALRGKLRNLQDRERALPEWWKLLVLDEEGASDKRRQQSIRAVVRRVTVSPATRRGVFDPRRVAIEWR